MSHVGCVISSSINVSHCRKNRLFKSQHCKLQAEPCDCSRTNWIAFGPTKCVRLFLASAWKILGHWHARAGEIMLMFWACIQFQEVMPVTSLKSHFCSDLVDHSSLPLLHRWAVLLCAFNRQQPVHQELIPFTSEFSTCFFPQ